MRNTRKNLLSYGAYLGGGVILTATGPSLWDVSPLVASLASAATTLCFMAIHLIIDTRHIARQACAQARRRRSELIALGKYVAGLEQRLASRGTYMAPVAAVQATSARSDDLPDAANNLLMFAARVSARCRPGASEPVIGEPSDQMIEPDAIASEHADLHLQPIVRLPTRRTVHYEALPPVTDTAGFSSDLETQHLAGVISLCNRVGERQPGTRIFCNLSAEALHSDAFRSELTEFMGTHAELARRLVFEMQASTALGLNAEAVADIRELEALGFAFSVDGATLTDLGKVYSVFSRLAFAKIDAAALIDADPNVLRALGKTGTEVIAVHIEDERQVVEINELGISYGQGHLFGAPRPAKTGATALRRAA